VLADPLTIATAAIRELVNRKARPLSSLEAIFNVSESLSERDAAQILDQLIAQRYLSLWDADLAQMLAQRLGREVKWSHATFNGYGWNEGSGSCSTAPSNDPARTV
jgi:hypothetical protein